MEFSKIYMLNRPYQIYIAAMFAGILLGISSGVYADDYQDAGMLFKQGQYDQSLEKVNAYLAGKPGDAKARFLKGLIITRQGNTPDAIKIFQALTVDYPELPEPYNNLAVLYAGQGQYDKAKVALEKAIRTHPSYATAHENLGDIYARMASQAYDRALQLDRGNTVTQSKLAMIQDLFAGGTLGKAPPPAAEKEHKTAAAPVATKPAATIPAPAENSAAPAVDISSEIMAAVNAWAAAWSAQDVDAYLSFYADDFNTPGGESRAAWIATRKERISTPKSIQVAIGKAAVKLNGNNHATVKFRQSYSANHLKASGNKTLLMVKSGGKWLIQEERAK